VSKIAIHDAVTGETVERDMTPEEEAQRAADEAAWVERKAVEDAAVEATVAARAALLERLGISEDEARLLLS
jgi:hypothetical protein